MPNLKHFPSLQYYHHFSYRFFRIFLHFMFPKTQNRPSELFQIPCIPFIPQYIGFYFDRPIALRQLMSLLFEIISMPEIPIDEYGQPVFRENHIRPAWNTFIMFPIPIPHRPRFLAESFPERYFQLRILAADLRHYLAPLLL